MTMAQIRMSRRGWKRKVYLIAVTIRRMRVPLPMQALRDCPMHVI